jgi:hypothetical protein
MNKPDEQASGKEAQEPKPSRLEEARRLIEEYAGDLGRSSRNSANA